MIRVIGAILFFVMKRCALGWLVLFVCSAKPQAFFERFEESGNGLGDTHFPDVSYGIPFFQREALDAMAGVPNTVPELPVNVGSDKELRYSESEIYGYGSWALAALDPSNYVLNASIDGYVSISRLDGGSQLAGLILRADDSRNWVEATVEVYDSDAVFLAIRKVRNRVGDGGSYVFLHGLNVAENCYHLVFTARGNYLRADAYLVQAVNGEVIESWLGQTEYNDDFPVAGRPGIYAFSRLRNSVLFDDIRFGNAPRLANEAPMAFSQSLSIDEDTSIPITLAALDMDGDSLSYTLTQPENGILSGVPPHLTYTPSHNFFGQDNFAFAVSDGAAWSGPGTVRVTVNPVNNGPVPVPNILSASILESNTTNFVLIATSPEGAVVILDGSSSYDPEADPLNFSWYVIREPEFTFSYEARATNVLQPGAYTVLLYVSDGRAVANTALNVRVITPCEAVENLRSQLNESVIPQRTRFPLTATLDASCSAFKRGDTRLGAGLLQLFQRKVGVIIPVQYGAAREELVTRSQILIDRIVAP